MRKDINSLKGRVETMEKRDKEINEKVAQLRSILDEATALLGRNSADLGAKLFEIDGQAFEGAPDLAVERGGRVTGEHQDAEVGQPGVTRGGEVQAVGLGDVFNRDDSHKGGMKLETGDMRFET